MTAATPGSNLGRHVFGVAGGADVHLIFPYATQFIVSFLRFFAQSRS